MDGRKATNAKDTVGVRKWRQFCTIPLTVMNEVGVAMLEGAMKYGRHNYRVAGVRASVYVDAAMGHVAQWWEGEDIDADSGLSHITKAIASLVVLRDAMIQDMLNDDRPPKAKLDKSRAEMQAVVDRLFEKYPNSVQPFTENGQVTANMDVGIGNIGLGTVVMSGTTLIPSADPVFAIEGQGSVINWLDADGRIMGRYYG